MRHILKLNRSLQEPIAHIEHSYQFITFDPEVHPEAWLNLNNRIFAKHPDQGNWAVEDLENRMAEPCLLYTSPSPRDRTRSRMPSSA